MKTAILLVLSGTFLAAAAPAHADAPAAIDAATLAKRIESGNAPTVLDVRTHAEYESGHIPGSINIPHDQLAGRLGSLPADKSAEIVVHCQSGRRAAKANAVLKDAGYTNVVDLTGHWKDWKASGLPSKP